MVFSFLSGPADAGRVFDGKIGLFWRLKSNIVALQLSGKRIAKAAVKQ
jgi:hypothetical protein